MIWFGTGSPKAIVFTDSATLKSRHFTVEQLLVASVASKTYTLPTPTKDLAGKPTWFMNSSTGSQTLSGTFVGGSTETILTKTMVALICQPQSPGVYKWVAFGNTAAITGLRETVEDYCAGLFTAGTQVGLTITYDDSGAAESIAIIYGAASDITDTGTTSTDKLAGAVAGKAANAGHKHALGAHTHVDATTGGAIAHTALTSIGTNTHAQLDTHVANTGATVHGLGTMSTQNAGTVAITGGTISGVALTSMTDLVVAEGGTGASSFTDGGILLGSGAAAITALGQATNGQLPIGATGLDPILATITAGDGIDVTNASGAITVATDVKANSGIVIDTTELSLDLSASAITGTLGVQDGGTGAATLTSHGLILGNGTGAVAILAEATNGQIPIGATGANPTLALPTGSEGVTVTAGAGTLALKVTDNSLTLPKIVSGSVWAAYVPILTWRLGVAPTCVTVARWMRTWNKVDFGVYVTVADGLGYILEGVTLPVATSTTIPWPFTSMALVNTTYQPTYANMDLTGSVIGADLAVNGAFSGDTDWTKGTNWAIVTEATKTTTTASALAQAVSTIKAGVTYRLTYTITTLNTGGTLTPSAGGVNLTPRTTAATFIDDFTATTTAALSFGADATWGGVIDNVTLFAMNPIGVILKGPVTMTNGQASKFWLAGSYEVV